MWCEFIIIFWILNVNFIVIFFRSVNIVLLLMAAAKYPAWIGTEMFIGRTLLVYMTVAVFLFNGAHPQFFNGIVSILMEDLYKFWNSIKNRLLINKLASQPVEVFYRFFYFPIFFINLYRFFYFPIFSKNL